MLDIVVYWAYRIGHTYLDHDFSKNWKGIIVKFNTSRHRTMLYKARSKLIRLKGWSNLLIKTTDFVKVIQTIKFWDVGTKLQWFNNEYQKKKKKTFFSSVNELCDIAVTKI